MIILGIDPGIAIVGYGVIEKIGNTTKILDYAVMADGNVGKIGMGKYHLRFSELVYHHRRCGYDTECSNRLHRKERVY